MMLRELLAYSCIGSIVLACILIWIHPATGDFEPDNPYWNGLKNFVSEYNVIVIKSLRDIPEGEGVALFEIPYRPYETWELETLFDFLQGGGTLVLMDDYGHGNEILSYLGLNVRFGGTPLLDPLFNYKNKWFPRITNISDTPITSGVDTLILNHATALVNASDIEVLAWSSRMSFLDLDGDFTWDRGEPIGPLPVLACTRVGKGMLIIVSDPSILINSMINMEDNSVLISNIIEMSSIVLFDASHIPETPLSKAKSDLRYAVSVISSPIVSPALCVTLIIFFLRKLWLKGD